MVVTELPPRATQSSGAKNETGNIYGRLRVLYQAAVDRPTPHAHWLCKCECGKHTLVAGFSLRQGYARSCGCLRRELQINDLTGQRFGHLVAICDTGQRYKGNVLWECKCDCGGTAIVRGGNLTSGEQKQCSTGCDGRPAIEHALDQIYLRCQFSALNRGLDFELTKQAFAAISQQPCHYCGAQPTPTSNAEGWPGNGLDRMDNNVGYTADNVAPCCSTCNYAKGSMPYAEFISWLDRVAARRRTLCP